ncbi:MAG: tRNA pseudouridine(55) synthase TruB [Candidatus Paceibacterota bacterium]
MTFDIIRIMLLNIYKPPGITSFDVVKKVRNITKVKKVGHGGTLDPFAEGVLIIGVGRESTKKLGNISQNTKKEYIATLELGKTSTTGDPEGEIRASSGDINLRFRPPEEESSPKHQNISKVLNSFLGKTTQTPSKYSAIKINGKRAYKLAREGKDFKMPEREIEIYEIELLNYKYPKLEIRVLCSSGTYIRTLAEDIGKKLNTGAYLTKLIRTKVGEHKVEDSTKLEDLSKEV